MAEYRKYGRLEPIEVHRLIAAVEEITREHAELTLAISRLERVWPQVRESLNLARRVTTGHLFHRARDRRPDPFA